jgi:hypothetical protein
VAANQKSILNGEASCELAHLGTSTATASVRHALSVPLADGDLRGALTLYRAHDPLFTTEDARILSTIAPKLAGAVANGLRFRRATDEAVTDALTGLPNVAALAIRLSQNASPGAVVVCDLDGFKSVNDRFGHMTGNRLLEALADLCCYWMESDPAKLHRESRSSGRWFAQRAGRFARTTFSMRASVRRFSLRTGLLRTSCWRRRISGCISLRRSRSPGFCG